MHLEIHLYGGQEYLRLFICSILYIKTGIKKAAFLTLGYMSQYAPWLLVTRTVFIYHYFPSVPFITVMLGYSFYNIVRYKPKMKKFVYVYVAVAIGLFALFYPVLSGYPITVDFANKFLKWFSTWVLGSDMVKNHKLSA